jgi:hypothetical protein
MEASTAVPMPGLQLQMLVSTAGDEMDDEKRNLSTTTDGKPPDPGFENAAAPGPIETNGQHRAYWVLKPEERAKGFIRPVRRSYRHLTCGAIITMGIALAETYSAKPDFYGATFCARCRSHFPVGAAGEFVWCDAGGLATEEKVGT